MEEGRSSPVYEGYIPTYQCQSPAGSSTGFGKADSIHLSPDSDVGRNPATTSLTDSELESISCLTSSPTITPSRSNHNPSPQTESAPLTSENLWTSSDGLGSESNADALGLTSLLTVPPPLPPTTESMLDDTSTGTLYIPPENIVLT